MGASEHGNEGHSSQWALGIAVQDSEYDDTCVLALRHGTGSDGG
jgi:hypothetical protein